MVVVRSDQLSLDIAEGAGADRDHPVEADGAFGERHQPLVVVNPQPIQVIADPQRPTVRHQVAAGLPHRPAHLVRLRVNAGALEDVGLGDRHLAVKRRDIVGSCPVVTETVDRAVHDRLGATGSEARIAVEVSDNGA